ncbi:MAG: DUF6273 domain-containing protein, partial [Oscillospiraceae bacterium]|nr:DUF6273 domain-containing protein [Oscillospiraceae bacterium]
MKRVFKRVLAVFLCLVLLGGAAPMAGIAQWAGGLTASAASKKITDYSVGDLVQFGSYPQSRVTDSATVAALNARATGWKSYGYYSGSGWDLADGSGQPSDYMRYCDVALNGSYYRGVTFDTYRSYFTNHKSTTSTSITYQVDNGYIYGNTYWFLYELLTWRVLDPATGLVLCENIIDSQAYNNYILSEMYVFGYKFWGDSARTHYANNYAQSSLRTWLNEDFYNTAFSDSEKLLITAKTRENKAYSPSYSKYDSASTTDKITLLTWGDMVNTSYGFSSSEGGYDVNRRASGTDYAKSQGLYVGDSYTDKQGNKCSLWWLRSASNNSGDACSVRPGGEASDDYGVSYTDVGVRPAFNFNLTSEISSSVHGPGDGSSGKLLVTRSFAQDEYGILVIDKFGNPIQDAAVTWNSTGNHAEEKTDKNGLAVFKALTLGQPTITAKKSGYITFSNAGTNYTKNANRYDIVTLYKDSDQESAYKLKSAKYINSTMPFGMDILTKTKSISLSDASVLGVRGDGKFDLSCVPNSMDGVKSIEVWQGNKKIASSTTTTIQGVEIQKFSEGGGVEIRVYTPDMGYVKTPVNLKFYKDKAVDPDDFGLKINSSLNLSLGSDVPYVGDGELSVKLPIELPVEFYTENDDGDWKFHLGVNTKIKSGEKNDEGKWTEEEKQTYKQQWKKY